MKDKDKYCIMYGGRKRAYDFSKTVHIVFYKLSVPCHLHVRQLPCRIKDYKRVSYSYNLENGVESLP